MLNAVEEFSGEQQRIARQVVSNLTGATITKGSDSRITVQTLLDATDVSVRQSVQQPRSLTLAVYRDALTMLTDKNPTESLVDRDDRTNRLYALIDRSFQRALLWPENKRIGINASGAIRTAGQQLASWSRSPATLNASWPPLV